MNNSYDVIPVKVNVLKGLRITPVDVAEIIKFANDVAKAQASALLEFDAENCVNKKTFTTNVEIGNKDAKITLDTEREGMIKLGMDELKKKPADGGFNGQGIKIFLADRIYQTFPPQGTGIEHWTGHPADGDKSVKEFTPVISLSVNDCLGIQNSNMYIARSLFQALFHNLTLGKKHKIDGRDADGTGHVDDPWNAMNKNLGGMVSGSHVLTNAQKAEIKKNIGKPATAKVLRGNHLRGREDEGELQAVNTWHALWTDSIGDAARRYLDLSYGGLFCRNPGDNLTVTATVNGFLPDSADTLIYEIGFDADGNATTGATFGPHAGIDKIASARLTGSYPYLPPNGETVWALRDAVTGIASGIAGGSIHRRYGLCHVDEPGQSETPDEVDVIGFVLPLRFLGFTADSIPYAIQATEIRDGAVVETDSSPLDEIRIVSEPGPSLAMTPLTSPPGSTVHLHGTGFSAGSPVSIVLDDTLLTEVTTDPTGSFDSDLVVPADLLPGIFFVMARDTRGTYDFSVLTIPENTDVADPAGAGGRAPLRFTVQPNPFHDHISFVLSGSGAGRLEIFDVGGRLVRSFEVRAAGSEGRWINWDGMDSSGRKLPAGLYHARLICGDRAETVRIVRIQ